MTKTSSVPARSPAMRTALVAGVAALALGAVVVASKAKIADSLRPKPADA